MTRHLVITGANGFVGAHVAALAAAEGIGVWAIGREDEPSAALVPHCDRYYRADLEHEWTAPPGADAIIHLAGLAAVGPSFAQPQRYLSVNTGIMTTMSEALLARDDRPRVVVVSTGAVYAPPADDEVVSESSPLAPTSPYAVAKIAVETQADYYARRGLDTVVVRPFNHIGPGQGAGFLVPDLTAALLQTPPDGVLRVGNLQAARDYTDVRDVARAYLAVAFAPSHRHRVYNVASGAAHSGRDVLETIAEALGREVPALETDPSRLRPNDPALIIGSPRRLADEFGWAPRIDWRASIRELVAQQSGSAVP
ncbi:NAD-dependent epimerase/dehydratase family protein [Microbacterium sp. BK668]|uniref:NAD-dependent epimerase/dehydratase family protein n=1 Tax=Microbacterium sp. BK668 TaxID=2512118 RepID=UPI0010D3190E|nr:NAD-dependent epimerase/dehydratase family protein [Microbacterium sp. BK668]TDN88381.1 GDP-4-dehydro-6-deoxy-D-mannose reductase [Microbacterium sp. BK668]